MSSRNNFKILFVGVLLASMGCLGGRHVSDSGPDAGAGGVLTTGGVASGGVETGGVVTGGDAAGGETSGGTAATGGDMDGSMPAPEPSVLLMSVAAGPAKLGALYELPLANLGQRRTLLEVEGGQPLGLFNIEDGGLSYNPVDGRFYGILPAGGWQAYGMVIAFDPTTDAVEYIAEIGPHLEYGGGPITGFLSAPAITEDGKGMMAVAHLGGRDALSCAQTRGDGALVHINIDASSADYGVMTPVYEFYSFGDAQGSHGQGIRGVFTQPVWGKTSGGALALWLATEGEAWNDNGGPCGAGQVPARWMSFTPSDLSDLAQPWTIERTGTFGGQPGLVGRSTLWDEDTGRFVYAWYDRSSSETVVETDDPLVFANPLITSNQNCHYNIGITPFGTGYAMLCRGYHLSTDKVANSAARLITFPSSLTAHDSPRSFPDWTTNDHKPSGMVYAKDASRLFVNVGDRSSIITEDLLGPGFSFVPSRLDEIVPSSLGKTTLVTGDETLGKVFVGQPAVGGPLENPDRYLVQLSHDGGSEQLGAIIKYDRIDKTTSHVSLGHDAFSFPAGRPFRASDDTLWLPAKAAGRDRWAGSLPGLGLLDMGTEAVTSVRNQLVSDTNLGRWNREYLEMPDSGEIWAVSPGDQRGAPSNGVYSMMVMAFDRATGLNDLEKSFPVASPVAADSLHPKFKGAVAGKKLWFVTPGPAAGQDRGLTCADRKAALTGDVRTWDLSFDPLVGPVAVPDESRLFLPGADGKLYAFPALTGSCLTAGESGGEAFAITEVVADLGDLPSTPLQLGSDGAVYYGTEAGTLVKFDPKDDSVTQVADMAVSGGSRVKGFIEEVLPGRWMGILVDSDGNGGSAARRIFDVDTAGAASTVSTADVSLLVAADDPYPGVVRYH